MIENKEEIERKMKRHTTANITSPNHFLYFPALVSKHKEEEGKRAGEKERCSGSYCQAVIFLVIKHDSVSARTIHSLSSTASQ